MLGARAKFKGLKDFVRETCRDRCRAAKLSDQSGLFSRYYSVTRNI